MNLHYFLAYLDRHLQKRYEEDMDVIDNEVKEDHSPPIETYICFNERNLIDKILSRGSHVALGRG